MKGIQTQQYNSNAGNPNLDLERHPRGNNLLHAETLRADFIGNFEKSYSKATESDSVQVQKSEATNSSNPPLKMAEVM